MHLIDYILLGLIAALAVLAIWSIRRQGMGCKGCASCPYKDSCKKSTGKAKGEAKNRRLSS